MRATPAITLSLALGLAACPSFAQTAGPGPGGEPGGGAGPVGGAFAGESAAGSEASGGGADTHAESAPEPGSGLEVPPSAAASRPAQRVLAQVGPPPPFAAESKWWEVVVGWESHFLLWRNNLNGAGSNKALNYVYLNPHVDFWRYNRVSFFAAAYERFLADQGETGLRLDDWVARYSRYAQLPLGITLDARVSATLPTSYLSQRAGMILGAGAGVLLDRQFASPYGDVDVELNLFGTYYFMQYTTAAGGNANPRGRVGVALTGEYALPIHNNFAGVFSLGSDFYAANYWYYDVTGGGAPGMTEPPASTNPDYPHQLPQVVYGGEVYARYQAPSVAGVRIEGRMAFAQGDTTLGYTGFLHDGVAHLYLSYYQSSQIYFALVARY